MVRKLWIAFALAALTVASAETYKINLLRPSYIGEKELKAGAYKVEVDGEKVTFTRGKESTEAQAKVETNDSRYKITSVRYNDGDGKFRIQEIRIGGTSTKLVFN